MYGFIFAWIWFLVRDWLLWESLPSPQTGPPGRSGLTVVTCHVFSTQFSGTLLLKWLQSIAHVHSVWSGASPVNACRSETCWQRSQCSVGTWALLSSSESHKHRDMGECPSRASIHGFLWITQDLGSCWLLESHLWCAEPCRIHSDTRGCGFGMEKQIPRAEEPIRRLRTWSVLARALLGPWENCWVPAEAPWDVPHGNAVFCRTVRPCWLWCPGVTWSLAVLQPALPVLVQRWGNRQQTLSGLFLVILKQRMSEHK